MTDEQLIDLLRPGMYGAVAKMTDASEPLDHALITRAEQWLREWVPQHREDFRKTFFPESHAWVKQQVGKP